MDSHFLSKAICLLLLLILGACTPDQKPQRIIYGKDVCEHCHMVISDPRFGGQIVTRKGKVFLFDSVNCLHGYLQNHLGREQKIFFVDSLQKDEWLEADQAHFSFLEALRSPMGAGVIAVKSIADIARIPESQAKNKKLNLQGTMKWEQLSTELAAGKFR